MDETNRFLAAFAQTDITPDFQVELIGCARPDSRSRGVLHPLKAQVLLMEHRGRRCCLACVDSLGLTVSLSNEIRAAVAAEAGIDASSVMLNFSHTHSAPSPLSPLNGARYFALLLSRIKGCAAEAAGRLKPCAAEWAMTRTPLGENRREGCTAVDTRLGALRLREFGGKPAAVLIRVTAHANVLMRYSDKISSDYFGPSREKLSAFFGCPVMLMQGAAGNVKPAGIDKIDGGYREDLGRISDILARSAEGLRFEPLEISRFGMSARDFLYVSDVPSEPEAGKIAADAQRLCHIDGTEWLNECARLRACGVTEQTQPGQMQFLRLNGVCFCGVPDELFCEIALEASRRAQNPCLFLDGYTNGCTGYLPHREEWVKGGYETHYSYLQYFPYHGHVMPYRADTAERLVALACSEWEQLRGE